MSGENEVLLDLAQRNAARFVAKGKVTAILLTGSVGRGEADGYSDIDMILYYETLPTEEECASVYTEAQGEDRKVLFADPEVGLMEQYLVEGVVCQFAHLMQDAPTQDIADVVERFSVDPNKLAVVGGIRDGRGLYGNDRIDAWKLQAASYPEGLTVALVNSSMQFYALWVLEKMIASRGDVLYLMEILVAAEKNLLNILFALNRRPVPHEWKRMGALIAGLDVAPVNLNDRLLTVLRSEPEIAIVELGRLIDETYDLVDAHLPTVNTVPKRAALHAPPRGLAVHRPVIP